MIIRWAWNSSRILTSIAIFVIIYFEDWYTKLATCHIYFNLSNLGSFTVFLLTCATFAFYWGTVYSTLHLHGNYKFLTICLCLGIMWGLRNCRVYIVRYRLCSALEVLIYYTDICTVDINLTFDMCFLHKNMVSLPVSFIIRSSSFKHVS